MYRMIPYIKFIFKAHRNITSCFWISIDACKSIKKDDYQTHHRSVSGKQGEGNESGDMVKWEC